MRIYIYTHIYLPSAISFTSPHEIRIIQSKVIACQGRQRTPRKKEVHKQSIFGNPTSQAASGIGTPRFVLCEICLQNKPTSPALLVSHFNLHMTSSVKVSNYYERSSPGNVLAEGAERKKEARLAELT